ncbi:hypothetical protein KSP39_PZI011204 [Platanthera zijinensis]|uniref:Uncharacterized protein n=1 Tax=Platanthera zijinensis TaxID=2320716 RepID=A0AAP0BGJ2_9ASPA
MTKVVFEHNTSVSPRSRGFSRLIDRKLPGFVTQFRLFSRLELGRVHSFGIHITRLEGTDSPLRPPSVFRSIEAPTLCMIYNSQHFCEIVLQNKYFESSFLNKFCHYCLI